MSKKMFSKLFVFYLLFFIVQSKNCDGVEIDNCNICNTGENSKKCLTCEDNYFIALEGQVCIKCDDPLLGMKGCLGRCEMDKSERNVKCIENTCKDGFYLLTDGMCAICSFLSEGCKRCNYLQDAEGGDKVFECLECNDNFYLEGNSCHPCPEGCSKCNDYSICTEAMEGYYLDGVVANSCQSSFYGCVKCKKESEILTCVQAEEGFYIKNNVLESCTDFNCLKCHIDESENVICDECVNENYYVSSIGTCKECRFNEECYICSDENKETCDHCPSKHYLNSEHKCSSCLDEFGEVCHSCLVSPLELKVYCEMCEDDYYMKDGNCSKMQNCQFFSYGTICDQCKENYIVYNGECQPISNYPQFINCLSLEKIGTKDNGEGLLSCKECNYNYAFVIQSDGSKKCVDTESKIELQNCYLAKQEDDSGNYICLKCYEETSHFEYNETLGKTICTCNEGYYYYSGRCLSCKDNRDNCRQCHYDSNVICDVCESGYKKSYDGIYCEMISSNPKCDESTNPNCIEPFFKNNENEIDSCSKYYNNCVKCDYNETNQLICSKCDEDYFLNKNGECQHCYINTDVGYHCIVCTDDEEVKREQTCQKCNKDYFLTKDYNCVYCKSDEYGGNACEQCGYRNIDGNEIITCIDCKNLYMYYYYYYTYPIFTNYGKCFWKYESCNTYGLYFDNNNNKKYGCIKCYDYYYLDEEHKCKSIEYGLHCRQIEMRNNKKVCISCESGYESIDGKCIFIIPNDNQIIPGCNRYFKENNQIFCEWCDDKYIYHHGFCYEKPSSNLYPFYENCILSRYDNGFIECYDCSFNYDDVYYSFYYVDRNKYMGKIGNYRFCPNHYYGYCATIENIGNDSELKYSCSSCLEYKTTPMEDEYQVTHCIYDIFNNRCLRGTINTNYFNDTYDCTECRELFTLAYSDYYETNICKYIYEDEKRGDSNHERYDADIGISANNGKCQDKYFTRNGNICIKCDDNTIGMPGCNGKCNFKSDRQHKLKCEIGKCKPDLYFEIIPGICELCDKGINYCEECSYTEDDWSNHLIPKRKRKLICSKCKEGYILKNGICLSCQEEIQHCSKCSIEDGNFKCLETDDGYYVANNGLIQRCEDYSCYKCKLENNELKCLKPSYYYFINLENKLQKCEEVIDNCENCQYEGNNLRCYNCKEGYRLKDNRCTSLERLDGLEGCLYSYFNGEKYVCSYCYDDYLYISNKGKCIKKTKETKYCSYAKEISNKNKTAYNCSYCESNLYYYDFYYDGLFINSDGYYYCQKSLPKNFELCKRFKNLGTYDEPHFVCEECEQSNGGFDPYSQQYTIAIDEFENTECIDSSNFILNCYKGTKTKILTVEGNYEYKYNCTSCRKDYEYSYNAETGRAECLPIICGVINCKTCKENDVYFCQECEDGFVLNVLGLCFLKPKETPTITFKDIFRFSLNGEYNLNGEKKFGVVFTLRGITSDDIQEKHTFILNTVLAKGNSLRNLDETKTLPAICENVGQTKTEESGLSYVDYECFAENKDGEDLSEYDLDSFENPENDGNSLLESSDISSLPKRVEDKEKYDSVFDMAELIKYIQFTVDENNNIEVNKTENFNFEISGKTTQTLENSISGELKLSSLNKKANCEVNANDKDNALLKCEADFTSSSSNKISFEEQEIIGTNKNVFFSGLNKIEINVHEIELADNTDEHEEEEAEEEKSNTGLIVGLSVGGGAAVLGGGGIALYFLLRKKTIPNLPETKPDNVKNIPFENKVEEGNVNSLNDFVPRKIANKKSIANH